MSSQHTKSTQGRYKDILLAAASLIREGGVGAVTTDRVRQKMRASTTTVYNHFANRDEILNAVFSNLHARYYANIEYKLQFADSPEREIITIVDQSFSKEIFTEDNIHVWLAYWSYALYHQDSFNHFTDAYNRSLDRTARILSELGVKNPDAAQQFWIFIDGLWLSAATQHKGKINRQECTKRALDYIEGILGRPVGQFSSDSDKILIPS